MKSRIQESESRIQNGSGGNPLYINFLFFWLLTPKF